ncbi:MAG: RIP metalloprotease RseP [Bacteroidaceae bacterium]|nr:RIP metalloprotease RseP [Bacteroidaceae bacterium]
MEAFIIKALQLILSLSILVTFHEFGHYIFARMFGIRVERFFMFFDYKFALISFKREAQSLVVKICDKLRFEIPMWAAKPGDTEFGIGWIPFGGYVKISGMIDESMDLEQMKQPAQPWEFRTKPAWQRLLVMIAGVLFNFILAIIIYAGITFHWGETYLPFENATAGMEFSQPALETGFCNGDIILAADGKKLDYMSNESLHAIIAADEVTVLRDGVEVAVAIDDSMMLKIMQQNTGFATYRLPAVVNEVEEGMGAYAAGLTRGDRIVGVDSISIVTFPELSTALQNFPSQPVALHYMRGDSLMTSTVMTDSLGRIGIMLTPINELFTLVTKKYSLWQSIPRGVELGVSRLVNYVSDFKYVFTKEGAQSLGGFGAIGSLFAPQWDWYSFWSMTAFLSVILAFMNILPIPALDGGHVLFLLYEVVTRRKPSDKFMEIAQTVGLFLLFALLIYANGNDIIKFFFK